MNSVTEEVPAPRRRIPVVPILVGTGVLACLVLLGALVLDGLKQKPLPSPALMQDTPRPTATGTPLPSPTAELQLTITALVDTANAAEAESLRAQREALAARAAEQDAVQRAIRADVEREALKLQNKLTDNTSTAWASGVTETAQAGASTLVSAGMTQGAERSTAAAEVPTMQAIVARAALERAVAPLNEKIRLTYQLCIGTAFLFISVAAGGHVLYLFLERKKKPIIITPDNPPFTEPAPIPFARVSLNVWRSGEIPCTEEQLLEFAEGVIHERQPLSINTWEGAGTQWARVGSYLPFRHFMQRSGFTRSTGSGRGDRELTAEGEKFLRDVLEADGPPTPFQCVPILREGEAHDAPNHDEFTEGEGLGDAI